MKVNDGAVKQYLQVSVPLEDAEVRENNEGHRYLPELVDIRFAYLAGYWSLVNVWLHGTAVKRDGSLGKQPRYELWTALASESAPEFVQQLIEQYRPRASEDAEQR
ncbi:hypothetical protein IU485_27805 [Nocardia cyriacigeorgica]|uniref:hypothetical protein n=1 Tax=Nocardia cyriacigeorgica TaxID=135487 RepID=UPI001893DF83|nr:hypothetical protein [Nocardia cyriacigeorgica]MBF6085183.1 hypothetical protein [Nocardia cyriacigeorgica]